MFIASIERVIWS